MPETGTTKNRLRFARLRHQDWETQLAIYLGKFLRMFLYQNDWKVLPMAAVIAGLLAMVTRVSFFQTMEGTLMGAFSLTCASIWNGCFNSIQVICRERDVVKREHRAGLRIGSYIAAHLIYQALLCLLQAGITVYVFVLVGVQFPARTLFTRWATVDIGVTVFLVSFAADALALWISSLARNTTAAMTVIPFLLIFQLIFSGGMLELPEWSAPITNLTISHHGMTALAAQADYNELPMVSLWWTLYGMRDNEVTADVTVGEVLDYLSDGQNPGAGELRATVFTRTVTLRELAEAAARYQPDGDAAALLRDESVLAAWGDEELELRFTLGEAVDAAADSPLTEEERRREISVHTTIGEIIDAVGEYRVYQAIQDTAGAARRSEEYAFTRGNVAACWAILLGMTLLGAGLAAVTLTFIDKDRR